MMSIIKRLFGRTLETDVREIDFLQIEHIYNRRFAGKDKERFLGYWVEIARILNISPEEMHEDDNPGDIAKKQTIFYYVIVEELFDLVLDQTDREPTGKLSTIGEIMDFLMDHSGLPWG